MEHTLSPIELAALRACVCYGSTAAIDRRADLLAPYSYKEVFMASHQLEERGFLVKDGPYFGNPTEKGQEVLDYIAEWELRLSEASSFLQPLEFLELVALYEATLRVDGLNGTVPDYLDPTTPHPSARFLP